MLKTTLMQPAFSIVDNGREKTNATQFGSPQPETIFDSNTAIHQLKIEESALNMVAEILEKFESGLSNTYRLPLEKKLFKYFAAEALAISTVEGIEGLEIRAELAADEIAQHEEKIKCTIR